MLTTLSLVFTIIAIIIGILNCFFGFWWFRVGLVICGLLIGAILGAVISVFTAPMLMLLLIIVFAVGLGILFGVLHKVGLFVLCFFTGFGIVLIPIFSQYTSNYFGQLTSLALSGTSGLMPQFNLTTPLIISALIGLAVAIIAVIFEKPVVIIISAIHGAILLSNEAANLLHFDRMIGLIITVVLAIIGILIQCALSGVFSKKRHNIPPQNYGHR